MWSDKATFATLVLAALVAPASGLSVEEAQEAASDSLTAADPTLRLVLCTPDDGNAYWVDYCFKWTRSTETVTYVESAQGEDPWCVIYPAPCAPSPDDPVQTATTTAHLTRLTSTVEVDMAEVCGDLWCPDICAYTSICLRMAWPGDVAIDGPVALADIDRDGGIDGMATRTGNTWTYAGFCDGHTLSQSCTWYVTHAVRPLTDYATLCTPGSGDYWVDHCTSYEAHPLSAQRTSAHLQREGDICIIYPAPCVGMYSGELVRHGVYGDVWTYRNNGEVDDQELLDDICQLDCPSLGDIEELCEYVFSKVKQPIGCNFAIIAAMLVAPPWWMPDGIDWTAALNAGLMDIDGDGMAEGMAVAYVPAWVGTSSLNDLVQYTADMMIPWEYVPFACFEVDPTWMRIAAQPDCMTVSIDVTGVSGIQ